MMDTTAVGIFLEYSPNPTWLADSDGHCIYVNRILREISAIPSDKIANRVWLDLVTPQDRSLSSSLWQQAKLYKQLYRARFSLNYKPAAEGGVVDVVGTGHMTPDGAEVWLFTAIPSPPSKLQPSLTEGNLQAILNAVPIQAWYARASGGLVFVNRTVADYLGLLPDHPLRFAAGQELAPDAHLAFLHPDDRALCGRIWKQVVESGESRESQFRLLGAHGEYRWFSAQAEPLRIPAGGISVWVGVNTDIDAGKRASEALDEARERVARATQSAIIAEIAAALSHKIVQPLAAMVANARAAINWLSSDNLDVSQANAALEMTIRDGMSVGNIVHKMRQHLDHPRPQPLATDMNALIDQVISLQAPNLRDKRIVVNRLFDPDLPLAFVDQTQMQQVLFNLIMDATEAISRSESPKELIMRTALLDDRVCIEAQGSGRSSIDLNDLLETVITDGFRSPFLALAVSRSIIQAQGGKLEAIHLESGATWIRIQLPRFTPA